MICERQKAIDEFLRTGGYDPCHFVWPGDALERCRVGERELRRAVLREVQRRSKGRTHPRRPDMDDRAFTRAKVEPMARGLFPLEEQEIVLRALENSVVFLTSKNIEALILNSDSPDTAWAVANLYLESVRVQLLGPDAPHMVGLSVETTCYLSTDYFHEKDRFADFLVHEAAHLFHSCRRRTIGLPETRKKPWPLRIPMEKHETFAYSCEFYSRILALSSGLKDRRGLFDEFRAGFKPADDRFDPVELLNILEEAINARHGWKRILARCSPEKPFTSHTQNRPR